jgi:hypothetical protein
VTSAGRVSEISANDCPAGAGNEGFKSEVGQFGIPSGTPGARGVATVTAITKKTYRLWFPTGPGEVQSGPDIETMERNGRIYWCRRINPARKEEWDEC